MGLDRLQFQRFELKYLVSEAIALAVRDFVRSYLEIDEYGATRAHLSYPVHSLYLDSDGMNLYQSTINGDKNRFKLRLRFYESRGDAPVYFEIKHRVNTCILKQRGGVRREAVKWVIAGHLPEPAYLVSPEPKQLVALQRFCQLMNQHRVSPIAHVAYLREAWISPNDNSVRVTMDREVRCEPERSIRLSPQMNRPILIFGKQVILELKFTDRFPQWFRQLVAVFGLMQCGAAKYVDGVTILGERRFMARDLAAQACTMSDTVTTQEPGRATEPAPAAFTPSEPL